MILSAYHSVKSWLGVCGTQMTLRLELDLYVFEHLE